jgi:tetratricopeptide (TPR) repeat protein
VEPGHAARLRRWRPNGKPRRRCAPGVGCDHHPQWCDPDCAAQSELPEAIRIFQLNIESFPQSSNTYDSLGEAYMVHGDKPLAIANYQESLRLNPKNSNGVKMLRKLNGSSS